MYDRFGHAGVGTAGAGAGIDASVFQDFTDIFGDFFGFGDLFTGGRSGRRTRAQRGADLREDITIEFEEAVFGTEKKISYRKHETCEVCRGSGSAGGKAPATCRTCGGHGQVRYQQGFFTIARTCPACQGAGSVISDPCAKCRGEGRTVQQKTIDAKIPAGVEDGTRIRFSGVGEAGTHGGPAGDLYVVLSVKEHPFFERQGNDLYCVIPISVTQAALGAEIRVPTLEGEQTLKIPEGTQSGATLKIRAKGVPVLNGRGKGDLFVGIRVQTPTKLTKRQRELLEELEGTIQHDNKPQSSSILGKMKDMFTQA
jgi:molecular chaperone DnaJ